jgi:hypothetical protein
MRITFQPVRQSQSGFALLIVLCFLAACLITFGSVMYWVSTNAKITQRNNTFNQSEAAAESATEWVISTMLSDFKNLSLNSSNYYQALTPPTNGWPVQYQFSSTNGNGQPIFVSIGPTNWTLLPSLYTGLQGLGQNCVIASTATPQNLPVNVPATVCQTVWFGTIPMCQYAVFYNVVLEINPGDTFTIAGRVHCNTNIYCTGAAANKLLTFKSNVDAAGTITNVPSPLDPQNGPLGGNRSGNVVYPYGQPMQGRDALNLPLGNTTNYGYAALESLLQLPPAAYAVGTAAAYTTNGQVYFANETDLVITNDSVVGTNISVFYQNANQANYLVKIPCDATNSYPTTNIITRTTNSLTHVVTITTNKIVGYTNIFYSYVTNVAFYDYREGATVQALQLDVGNLGDWLGNTNPTTGGWQYEVKNCSGGTYKGAVISSVYIYNSLKPVAGSVLPAVRIVNGMQLPTNSYSSTLQAVGLGIATAQPLYVEGNYNVTVDNQNYAYSLGSTTNGCTLPACLIGDAITLLSSNFVDNGSEKTTATQNYITLNAASFEGIVPSNGAYYSGGLENFLRLLEDWGGKTITYNGSIVVMFPSTYATNHWGSAYYGAPIRAWGFDATFMQQGKQPPLFPSLKADARSAWTYQ